MKYPMKFPMHQYEIAMKYPRHKNEYPMKAPGIHMK